MKTINLLQFESETTPDARFRQLADALTLAMLLLPSNQDKVFIDDCRKLERMVIIRGRQLASLN